MEKFNIRRKATSERDFGMSKYIIKNCPNSWTYNRPKAICGLTYKTGGFKGETTSYKHCQDCTDCVLKQIYDLCKEDYTQFGDKELRYDTLEDIIKLLDIQEVE